MHITLRQLMVFSEIIKYSSTTRAAQTLALSQSAVSAALAELENQLSVKLFDRVGKRLYVNEYGRLLYPKAMALLEQAIEIEQLFAEHHGALRIAASSTIGNYLLPQLIAAYREDYPDSPLEVQIANSRNVITAVTEFRADFGLIEGPCYQPELVTEHWCDDEMVVFASSHQAGLFNTVSVENQWHRLAQAQWILREPGSGTREVIENLLLVKLSHFNVVMELGDSEAIKHAVRYGMGMSCLSRRVVAEQLQAGTLVELPVQGVNLMRPLHLIYHKQKHISQAQHDFLHYSKKIEGCNINTANSTICN